MQISTHDIRQYKNALIVLPLTDTVPSKVPTQTILGVNYDQPRSKLDITRTNHDLTDYMRTMMRLQERCFLLKVGGDSKWPAGKW